MGYKISSKISNGSTIWVITFLKNGHRFKNEKFWNNLISKLVNRIESENFQRPNVINGKWGKCDIKIKFPFEIITSKDILKKIVEWDKSKQYEKEILHYFDRQINLKETFDAVTFMLQKQLQLTRELDGLIPIEIVNEALKSLVSDSRINYQNLINFLTENHNYILISKTKISNKTTWKISKEFITTTNEIITHYYDIKHSYNVKELSKLFQTELGYTLIWEGEDEEGKQTWVFEREGLKMGFNENTISEKYDFETSDFGKMARKADKMFRENLKKNPINFYNKLKGE